MLSTTLTTPFYLPGPGPALTEPKVFISAPVTTTTIRLLASLGVGK